MYFSAYTIYVIVYFGNFFNFANAVICTLCDSLEGNCVGSSCLGVACVKREAFVDGLTRVQKMCQMSDNGFTLETCRDTVLWQGRYGTECVCQSDWCNSNPELYISVHKLSIMNLLIYLFYKNYIAF